MASPQLAEQKAEVKETDLPKDTPTEAEDPDRVVTPNESKKPKEDDPKVAAVATAGFHRVGCGRSDGHAQFRSYTGRAAFDRAWRLAPARPRAACARRGRRN